MQVKTLRIGIRGLVTLVVRKRTTKNESAEGTEFVRYCIILEATQFSNLCYSFLYRKFEMNTTHSNL